MTDLRPACGFFAPEGVPFDPRLAEAFATRADVTGQPLCFRIHVAERDQPHAQAAREFAEASGMVFMLSIVDGSSPMAGVAWSRGNGHDWRLVDASGTYLQDDSGPVGAANILANGIANGRHLAFHAYGQTGFHPESMLPLLAFKADEHHASLIWTECHWGFPGFGKSLGDRPDVVSAGAGAYVRDAVLQANRSRIHVAVYTPKFFFSPTGELNAAGRVLFGEEEAAALPVPRVRSRRMFNAIRSATIGQR